MKLASQRTSYEYECIILVLIAFIISSNLGSHSRSGVQASRALALLGGDVRSCPPAADGAGYDGDTAAPIKKGAIKKKCISTVDKKADREAAAVKSMLQVTTKRSKPAGWFAQCLDSHRSVVCAFLCPDTSVEAQGVFTFD